MREIPRASHTPKETGTSERSSSQRHLSNERQERILGAIKAVSEWQREVVDGARYRAGIDTPVSDIVIAGCDLSLAQANGALAEGILAASADALSETDDKAIRTAFKTFSYIFGPTPIGPINDLTKELGKAMACGRLKKLEKQAEAALEDLYFTDLPLIPPVHK